MDFNTREFGFASKKPSKFKMPEGGLKGYD